MSGLALAACLTVLCGIAYAAEDGCALNRRVEIVLDR